MIPGKFTGYKIPVHQVKNHFIPGKRTAEYTPERRQKRFQEILPVMVMPDNHDCCTGNKKENERGQPRSIP